MTLPLDTSDIDRLTLLGGGGPLEVMMTAIDARLRLGFPERKFVHQVFPARPTKAVWQQYTQRLPAVGFGFVGVAPHKNNGRLLRGNAQWSLFVANKNPIAGPMLAGTPTMPGLLAMASLAAAIFQGWTIPRVGGVQVTGVQNAFAEEWPDESVGVALLAIDVDFVLTDERGAARMDDFLQAGIDWPYPDLPGADVFSTLTTIREG